MPELPGSLSGESTSFVSWHSNNVGSSPTLGTEQLRLRVEDGGAVAVVPIQLTLEGVLAGKENR